mmetsp:Transcript_16069/g.38697  ORF Transcript_16069/g.38697 Transcript_16069/m.38697 type:complete len:203 (-) Transcript_16069:517-1125(-)
MGARNTRTPWTSTATSFALAERYLRTALSMPDMWGALSCTTLLPAAPAPAKTMPASPSIHENIWIVVVFSRAPHWVVPSAVVFPPTCRCPFGIVISGRASRFPVDSTVPETSGRRMRLSPVGFSAHSCVYASSSALITKFKHPEIRDDAPKLITVGSASGSSTPKLASSSSSSPSSVTVLNTRSSVFPVVITVPVASGKVIR